MAYPSLRQSYASKESRLSGRQVDRATNGAPRGRVFFTSQKKTFQVVHTGMTDADKATIEAFYAANSLLSFSFVWRYDAATYTCIFGADEPTYTRIPKSDRLWEITVMLVQV